VYHIIYMSTNKYCTACGTKHVVGLTPLKFCSNCGNPFDAAIAAQQQKQQTAAPQPTAQRVVNNYHPHTAIDAPADESFEVPQINASDFIVEIPRKLTVADIRNSPGSGGGDRGEAASPMLTGEQAKEHMARMFEKEREFVTSNKNKA
jgi:hypothetical protein